MRRCSANWDKDQIYLPTDFYHNKYNIKELISTSFARVKHGNAINFISLKKRMCY